MLSDTISVKTLAVGLREALQGDAQSVPKWLIAAASAGVGMYLLRTLRDSLSSAATPPGSLGLPLLGETLSFVMDSKSFVQKRKAKHGPVFKTHILFSPAVYLDGEHAKLLFKNAHIGWPSTWNELLGPYSMATISGPRHKFQRSVVASAFQPAALKSYLPTLQELSMQHLAAWADSTQGFRDPEPEIQLYTFEIAEKILLGTNSAKGELMSALKTFKLWLDAYQGVLPFNVRWTAHGKGMRARAELMKLYQSVIDQKRANPSPEDSDMLTKVMNARENGEPMKDAELLDFCLVMMFAGHDTTKCMLQSMIFYLNEYPNIAKELEGEVCQIWDGKSPLNWEMVDQAQKGKCGRFIAEVLRLKAPVVACYRVVQEDLHYAGFLIPKGWKLVTSPVVQNEQVSKNPNIDLSIDHTKFREDEYSPFGGGSRKCIGYNFAKLELIVWLMCALKHFTVNVEEGKSQSCSVPFIVCKVRCDFGRKNVV